MTVDAVPGHGEATRHGAHPEAAADPSGPRIGLALGGGGARGIAHIHVLHAFDDLGLKPARIAGTSIGALIGAAYASGLSAQAIEDHVLASLANRRLVAGTLWRTRPPSFAEFVADGGLRLGQLNAERVVPAFLPPAVPSLFSELRIPLTIMVTDFYGACERALSSGDLRSALGASAALPAVFRPVRRDGCVLIDGGMTNPLPFDVVMEGCDAVLASDVTGGPEGSAAALPTPTEAMFGASQLMMQSIIRAKLACVSPDILIRPAVSAYRVLDFLRARTILTETASVREDTRRQIEALFQARRWPLSDAADTRQPV